MAPTPTKIFGNIAPPLPKQTFPVMDLTGGLYRRRNPILVRPNQWYTLQNWVPYQGGIKKIGGYRVNGVPITGDVRVKGLYEYVSNDLGIEQRRLLINAGGKLYSRLLPQEYTTSLFADPFTRADATHLGQNWIDPKTTENFQNGIGIDTNRAEVQGLASYAGGVGYAWYYADIGSVDYNVEATVQFTVDSDPSVNRWAGLISKVKDRDNHYRFEVSGLGSRLFKRKNGTDTLLKSSALGASTLFSDGFESYTSGAAPTGDWNETGAKPPWVVTSQIGPDGSSATLQIEGSGFGDKVGRPISDKWAYASGNPIIVSFGLKQTAQAAVTTNIFGLNENSTLNNAAAKLLLRLSSAHVLQFQCYTGGSDTWVSSGRTLALNRWYSIKLELQFAEYRVYVDGVSVGGGQYPGPITEHDLGYIYFTGGNQAASSTFVDTVKVSGAAAATALTETTLFTEDFEGYTADVQPDDPPWVAGWGETNFRTRTTVAHGGTKSLCTWENIGSIGHNTKRYLYQTLTPYTYIDFDFYIYLAANPDFNYNASYYSLNLLFYQLLSGSGSWGSLYYKATSGAPLAVYYDDPATPGSYIKLDDMAASAWKHIRLRYWTNKIELFYTDMTTAVATKNLASNFSQLVSMSWYRYPTNTTKIYVDDITLKGTSNPVSGTEESVSYALRMEHRGSRIDCYVDDTLALSYNDPENDLQGYAKAGISGYIDSLFDDFAISGPAADSEIGDIPDGFYDYCTILNQAIICINNGYFGISVPYRFDGTTLVRMDQLAAPTTAPTAALDTGATPPHIVTAGSHFYTVTFVDALGNESNRAMDSTTGAWIESNEVITDGTNNKVNLTNIPLGGSSVVARNLYRTTASGGVFLFLATINDNTTQTYTDILTDLELETTVAPEDHDAPPMAGFCAAHMNRLYLTGDPSEPDIVYASHVGDILAFPAKFQLPFNRNSGDRNTALHVYNDKAHIFKTEQIGYITDTDSNYWAINQLSMNHGCVCWRGIRECAGALIVPSKHQISAILGNRIINLSREIDGLLEELDPNEPFYRHAVNNLGMKRYELFYRERGSAWPNKAIFMHYDESISGQEDASQVWSGPHDLPFSCSASIENDKSEPRVVAGSVENDGTVFMTEQGLNFNGQASVSIATGPQTSFGLPDLEKRLRGMYFYWKATHVAYVQVHRDFDFYPAVTHATLQPVFSPKNRLTLGGTCRFAAATFYHDTLDEDIEIYGYSWLYQQLTLRR